MAAKLFLNEPELRRLGMGEPNIATLRKLVAQANVQAQIDAANEGIDANASSIAELAANDTALQGQIENQGNQIDDLQDGSAVLSGRIDAYDALAPFVRQDQSAAPVYTPYAGQTVSVLYTQAEAQATDDAVKALGVAVDALITALQAANVLT